MPLINAGGLDQYYRLEGNQDRPVLVFSHSLGCDHSLWDAQAPAMLPRFRVLRYDTRGHGATTVTNGDYSIELLARDALALLDALGIQQVAWCGLSLGGMIGQWLAAKTPGRLTHLVLANTSSKYTLPGPMEERRRLVLEHGMEAVEQIAMGRFFLPETLAARLPGVATVRQVLLSTNPIGYAGCCAAIRDLDNSAFLSEIRTPTMIVAGSDDQATPWKPDGETLAAGIAGARVEHLPAAHLSAAERPHSFNALLNGFLLPQHTDRLASGFEKRRAVLGDAYVDRAIASTTRFTAAFQDLITRYCWSDVWQRPGLDDRTRKLLALTAAAALGRWEEFRLHVRGGGGLETCDIEEALLQLAIYAGVPAANTAFKIASEEIPNITRPAAQAR